MPSLWPRLEPLLARVQKPARYIGCEDGAQVPQHAAHKVAWLLAYPDTYEIGLPNQGLQILYEILNERPDAVPVRSADRRPEHPLIGAGGHCTYNPEPLADLTEDIIGLHPTVGRQGPVPGRGDVPDHA